MEYMLKTNFKNFPKEKNFSTILRDFLGKGIFNVHVDTWRFQKKMASLHLNNHSLVTSLAVKIINKHAHPLLQKNNALGVMLDLQDVFQRFSFDNIYRFSFGLDPDCLTRQSGFTPVFVKNFDLTLKLFAERATTGSPFVWKLKRLLNLGSRKQLKKAVRVINVLVREVIQQRCKKGFSKNKDLLSSFLLAGRDTVASALTSFFLYYREAPEVESKIHVLYINRVIGHNKDLTSFQELKQLHYLQVVAHKSMRLFPPIQFDSKFCLEDNELPNGDKVESGTKVTYHPYAMGRLEEI
ncbi:Cytochrome P450 94C1 [Glycine max]|nr:Cytochrome P450 94C1 [Glycine max]